VGKFAGGKTSSSIRATACMLQGEKRNGRQNADLFETVIK